MVNKQYGTGLAKWRYGESYVSWHIYLGPCPQCGSPTFDYGGGWRCCTHNCRNSTNNPAPSVGERPSWWNTDINVSKDGEVWCATRDVFVNLQESDVAFGATPGEAVANLLQATTPH